MNKEDIKNGLLGVALGDAVGVPAEFRYKGKINNIIEERLAFKKDPVVSMMDSYNSYHKKAAGT